MYNRQTGKFEFKQRFAQVTNPPIDAIREKVVTSTSVYIGAHGNLLEDKPENCKVLKVQNPILTSTDLLKIKHMNVPGFKTATVSINYYKNTSLEKAIDRVFLEVDRAYKDGANIIILSDRDIDEYHVSIPSLLAVSAVSQYLIRTKKSTAMALILESAEPHEVHHFATLLGQRCHEGRLRDGLSDRLQLRRQALRQAGRHNLPAGGDGHPVPHAAGEHGFCR